MLFETCFTKMGCGGHFPWSWGSYRAPQVVAVSEGPGVVEHGCSIGVLFQLLVVEETRLVCLWSSGMESYFTRGLEEELGI